MSGPDVEQGCPVVHHDARSRHHQARSEIGEHAVDQRAGVPRAVDHADVYGVAARNHLAVGRGVQRPLGVDQAAPALGVLLGCPHFGGHVGAAWVGQVFKRVGKSQPGRLDQVMVPFRALGAHARNVESFDDVQRLQGHNALTVGRTLPAGHAPVVRLDGFVPIRAVRLQIFFRQPAALFLDELCHHRRYWAGVKRLAAALRHCPQRARQSGQSHDFPLTRGAPVHQQLLARRQRRQLVFLLLPLETDDVAYGKPVLRVIDGWRQRVGQAYCPFALQQHLPPVHGSGNRDG